MLVWIQPGGMAFLMVFVIFSERSVDMRSTGAFLGRRVSVLAGDVVRREDSIHDDRPNKDTGRA